MQRPLSETSDIGLIVVERAGLVGCKQWRGLVRGEWGISVTSLYCCVHSREIRIRDTNMRRS